MDDEIPIGGQRVRCDGVWEEALWEAVVWEEIVDIWRGGERKMEFGEEEERDCEDVYFARDYCH